jgi:phosphoribosylformimino-5-aminoimidazole carboxamide ribotide isomerase
MSQPTMKRCVVRGWLFAYHHLIGKSGRGKTTLRVIGVLDLAAGHAVHARGGSREQYSPVRGVAGSPIEPGDAVALARAYTERLGVTELYAADLDAIGGLAMQDALVLSLAGLGARLWLDAGVASADGARHALRLGATKVVVGLETLPSFEALKSVCAAVGRDRVAFSLDLRDGEPVVSAAAATGIPYEPAHVLAARARDAGVGSVIVIDLARVGGGTGVDLDVVARVRDAVAGLTLIAGGGVRGPDDLVRLADAGCDAALVASALLAGGISAADIAAAGRVNDT